MCFDTVRQCTVSECLRYFDYLGFILSISLATHSVMFTGCFCCDTASCIQFRFRFYNHAKGL